MAGDMAQRARNVDPRHTGPRDLDNSSNGSDPLLPLSESPKDGAFAGRPMSSLCRFDALTMSDYECRRHTV